MNTWMKLATGAVAAAVLSAAGPARVVADQPPQRGMQTAVLAGGCFWGLQAVFERLRGVSGVDAGFAGGNAQSAHYEIVSTGLTGHAESVRITFDPSQISYAKLLDVYFTVAHDPTELNRQGPDDGSQYRSEIFTTDAEQQRIARETIARLTAAHAFGAPIVTKIEPLRGFYAAESYHQHFYDRNPTYPYIVENDAPKVARLREKFASLVKDETAIATR